MVVQLKIEVFKKCGLKAKILVPLKLLTKLKNLSRTKVMQVEVFKGGQIFRITLESLKLSKSQDNSD